MALLHLTRGYVAIIDDEDIDRAQQHRWFVSTDKKKNVLYAKAKINKVTTGLHRFLLNAKRGQIIDHIDGNGLNNQKSNLRFCTQSQNRANIGLCKNNITGFKGVYFNKLINRYTVEINRCKKRYRLGSFISAVEAAKAYNEKAKELFGDFARLNNV